MSEMVTGHEGQWTIAVEFDGFTSEEQNDLLHFLNREVPPHTFIDKIPKIAGRTPILTVIVTNQSPNYPAVSPMGHIEVSLFAQGEKMRDRLKKEIFRLVDSWWGSRNAAS